MRPSRRATSTSTAVTSPTHRELQHAFGTLVRRAGSTATPTPRSCKDVQRMERHVRGLKRARARGLAMFSCTAHGLLGGPRVPDAGHEPAPRARHAVRAPARRRGRPLRAPRRAPHRSPTGPHVRLRAGRGGRAQRGRRSARARRHRRARRSRQDPPRQPAPGAGPPAREARRPVRLRRVPRRRLRTPRDRRAHTRRADRPRAGAAPVPARPRRRASAGADRRSGEEQLGRLVRDVEGVIERRDEAALVARLRDAADTHRRGHWSGRHAPGRR